MPQQTRFDQSARKALRKPGGFPALLVGQPDLASPRSSAEYIRVSKQLHKLLTSRAAERSDSGAAAGGRLLREALPVGNTGITSNVSPAVKS